MLADDEADFTHALGRLLDDPALRDRLGVAADKHARSFTWEASQSQFADVVAWTLAGRPSLSGR